LFTNFLCLDSCFIGTNFFTEDTGEFHCDALVDCLAITFTQGITGGGISDLLEGSSSEDGLYLKWGRILYEMLFFILVITIVMNIVFGIIVDTFQQLRDDKKEIEDDIRTKCFICGQDSHLFDRHGFGFQNHIKMDHNMWQYLYFILFLQQKDHNEYTGQESYVAAKVKQMDWSFVPLGKALVLEHLNSDESDIHELEKKLITLSSRVEDLEKNSSAANKQLVETMISNFEKIEKLLQENKQ